MVLVCGACSVHTNKMSTEDGACATVSCMMHVCIYNGTVPAGLKFCWSRSTDPFIQPIGGCGLIQQQKESIIIGEYHGTKSYAKC